MAIKARLFFKMFIDDQQGHSEVETAGAVERESRKQQVRVKVARPVDRKL